MIGEVKVNGKRMPYTTMVRDASGEFSVLGVLSIDDINFKECDYDYVKVEDGEDKKLVKYDCPSHRKDIMPDKIIFNGNCTIAFHDDDKIIVKCDTEDKFSKVFGFLYSYFLLNSKMSKTQARKFFEDFGGYEVPKKKVDAKVDKVEKLLKDKSLSLDEFEKRMRNLLDDYMA